MLKQSKQRRNTARQALDDAMASQTGILEACIELNNAIDAYFAALDAQKHRVTGDKVKIHGNVSSACESCLGLIYGGVV